MALSLLAGDSQTPGQVSQEIITFANHGFVAGNAVYKTNGGWSKSQADTAANAEVTGVVQQVIDTNNFSIVYVGKLTFSASDISNLVDGSLYFLSATTPGLLTTTPPSLNTQVIKAIFTATGASSGVVENYIGYVIQAANSAKFAVNLNAVDQSIPNGATTKIAFSTRSIDTANGFDATTNYRYTVVTAGYYFLFLSSHMNALSAYVAGYVYKNGAVIARSDEISSASNGATNMTMILVNLAAGDYIEFFASHSLGSAQNLSGTVALTYAGGYQVV